jgi:pimeloyl-ACP methyl ester carboxylesterase
MTLTPPAEHYIVSNRITIHCTDHRGDGTPLILMHGLTANAAAFDGVLLAGLAEDCRVLTPDLRGRGLTSMPAFGYSMQDHAADILGMMDAMGLQKVNMGGHSYGGLLSAYIAALYPERVEKVVLLDAAARLNSRAAEMLGPTISRLDKRFASFEAYLDTIKAAPYLNFWDEAMTSYYRADVKDLPDGSVTPRSTLAHIIEVSIGVANVAWPALMRRIKAPTLLLHAQEDYNLGQPLVPDDCARETIQLLANGLYQQVPGNHQTMLYGPGAQVIASSIAAFLNKG